VFSGSLPPGVSPARQAEMIGLCRSAGSEAAVDGSGPALAAAVRAEPWLIKPNRHEFEELLGRALTGTEDLLEAGRRMARSIPLVLVSCGAEGAYLFASGEAWHGRCEVPAQRIVSTVGCGDTLLAGFLAGCYRNVSITESLRLAVAAAGATAMNLSATFTREQFEEMMAKVEVEASPQAKPIR